MNHTSNSKALPSMLPVSLTADLSMFNALLDLPAYLAARALFCVLWLLPRGVREAFFTFVARVFLLVVPRYRHIAMKNIALVFPDKPEEDRQSLLNDSLRAMARFVSDGIRLPSLDRTWVESHVELPDIGHYHRLKAANPGKGVLYATGHLGSFEVLARSMALSGYPMSFVVRNFELKLLDRWWTSMREVCGNKVIARTGAFKEVIEELERGRDTAFLFDQNVKRNHATFVPFFHRPAATTKAVALAALRTKAPVIVGTIQRTADDRYRVHMDPCDFEALYQDNEKSSEEKISEITKEITQKLEKRILESPAEWFWMHRRWKTTPAGMREDFYA